MWLLVRKDAVDDYWESSSDQRVLAANPDTDERGDPWRWTAQMVEDAKGSRVQFDVNPDYINVQTDEYTDGYSGEITRPAGHQLLITSLVGEVLVSAVDGPWKRWLSPGDVFIIEGEEEEKLRISLTAPDAKVSVTVLQPLKAPVLRWVP